VAVQYGARCKSLQQCPHVHPVKQPQAATTGRPARAVSNSKIHKVALSLDSLHPSSGELRSTGEDLARFELAAETGHVENYYGEPSHPSSTTTVAEAGTSNAVAGVRTLIALP
jgi:hypothetical protein